MDFVWALLQHTPIWVYILFVFLMYKGCRLSKDHWMDLNKIWIFPGVFFVLSIESMATHFGMTKISVIFLGFGLLCGVMLGLLNALRVKHLYEVEVKRIFVPGSVLPMIQILMIFTAKYYFGYMENMYPAMVHDQTFMFEVLGISGLCTGLFIGPMLKHLYYVRKGSGR